MVLKSVSNDQKISTQVINRFFGCICCCNKQEDFHLVRSCVSEKFLKFGVFMIISMNLIKRNGDLKRLPCK